MEIDQHIQDKELPDSLVEIMETIGRLGAMRLVEQCGGTRVFVPKKIGAQHKLANL